MTTKRRTLIFIAATLLAIAVCAGFIVTNMLCHSLSPRETSYIYIDDNDNIDSVCQKLVAIDADISMTAFNWLVAAKHYDQHIRTGRYEVSNQLSTLDLFRNLRNHNSKPINLVVPSVRSIDIMAGRLAHQLMIDSTMIAAKFHDQETIQELGYTQETLPALFIPNTYEIYWETSVDRLVERFVKENNAFWNASRTEKAKQIGLTKNEVVTLASIIDSETANNSEKTRIAGLYMNRLHRGILLQSDPTVIFAVGDFTIRRVLNKHLQVESPYNTYKVQGLPPGPIRIPSIAGIDAVLNYEHNDYIYMCAKEDFSGTHNFAVSYADHIANARRYINALNQRGIK